jgi:hypothetical protein
MRTILIIIAILISINKPNMITKEEIWHQQKDRH